MQAFNKDYIDYWLMNFKSHLIAGTISGLVISGISYYIWESVQFSAINGVITLAASLAPDIDTGSIPSRIFALIGLISNIVFLWIGKELIAALIVIVYMLFSVGKHRGFTHKWGFPFLCIVAFYVTGYIYLASFAIGLIIHYIVDNIPFSDWI